MTIQVKANGQNFHVVLTVYHAVNGESVQSFGRSMDGTLLLAIQTKAIENCTWFHIVPFVLCLKKWMWIIC